MERTDNTTIIQTKSGTKVYVVGNTRNRNQRIKDGDFFVDVYNRNFTEQEQRRVGNIYYDFNNKNKDTNLHKQDWAAATGSFIGDQARELNPHHEKMIDMFFHPNFRRDESCITHEIIHAKKFMAGVKGNHHNERKVEFESVGRMSRRGVVNMRTGYYYGGKKGNPHLAKKRGLRLTEKDRIAKEGIYADRRLLTGSLNHSIIGKTAERKVNRLFPKSFFFKRKF